MRDASSVLLVLAAACGSVDPRPDFDAARASIRAATAQEEVFDPQAPPLAPEAIAADLADGLTLHAALRLALLNNRRLQAGFMQLGIARADWVQAGLLKNPSLSLGFLFPSGGGQPKIVADLLQNVSDLWQIPARRAWAQAGLEQQILLLSRQAGELVANTRDAYVAVLAARATRANARASAALAQQVRSAVQRQVAAGVATRTDDNLAHAGALAAELAFRRAEREEVTATRQLGALLSLDGDLLAVPLADALPVTVAIAGDRETLVARGRAGRLDVRAAAAAVRTAEAQVSVERQRWLPAVALGVAVERPESGGTDGVLVGPMGSIELPIFDQNRAQVSRAEYRLEQARREHEGLVAEVGQEVRAAFDRAASAVATLEFVTAELVPQAERGVVLARTAWEEGNATVLTLLEAERALLQARQARIDAQVEAARARVDVERALGGPMEPPAVDAATSRHADGRSD